ncbi:hypothetical protein GOBAR_AA20434 [Gossypium barbadense]|uniref:Uncharacterized protein n=1 Tax=Gossypium barbadense TaxID=3634 RepID=A0A2P5XA57_GOSBA|nr:hypothetical protein GOBAR_DD36524 [Gossypium barbadense]PPS00231.1 hypothetical protein GOBAR_AA20434 [Gossypium barbadense]
MLDSSCPGLYPGVLLWPICHPTYLNNLKAWPRPVWRMTLMAWLSQFAVQIRFMELNQKAGQKRLFDGPLGNRIGMKPISHLSPVAWLWRFPKEKKKPWCSYFAAKYLSNGKNGLTNPPKKYPASRRIHTLASFLHRKLTTVAWDKNYFLIFFPRYLPLRPYAIKKKEFRDGKDLECQDA